MTITISDWLLISATVSGPIIAVQVQKFIEKIKERQNRKLQLFHTLMATRAARVSDRHVDALNMIEIEYDHCRQGKGKQVINAWRNYLNILNDKNTPRDIWLVKQNEHFIELLQEMSAFLKHDYSKVDIQNIFYFPEAQSERDALQMSIARGLAEVLNGHKPLPVSFTEAQNSIKKRA